jgi:hypothetical protein
MSLATMSPRDRRALFWMAAILIPSLGYVWGVKPMLASLDATRQQVFDQRQLLAHEQAAVDAAKRNPDMQRIADSAMRAMTPRLFEGRDDVMATAELVSHLGVIAYESNVDLQSASTRPTTTAGGVRTLRVDIRAESDITGVLVFLQSLESGEKLLRVERLDISRSLAAPEAQGLEPLSIAASIVGFAIPDPSAIAEPPARGTPRPVAPARPGSAR